MWGSNGLQPKGEEGTAGGFGAYPVQQCLGRCGGHEPPSHVVAPQVHQHRFVSGGSLSAAER
jgi:hypothetical protein